MFALLLAFVTGLLIRTCPDGQIISFWMGL